MNSQSILADIVGNSEAGIVFFFKAKSQDTENENPATKLQKNATTYR